MFLAIGVGSGSAAVAQGPATAVDTTKKAGVPDAPIADYNAPKRYIVNKVTVSGVKFLDPEIIAFVQPRGVRDNLGIEELDTGDGHLGAAQRRYDHAPERLHLLGDA